MASNTSTWEQSPPHRPGLFTDLLNGLKTNEPGAIAPDAISAEEFNQLAAQVAALARVSPVLVAAVAFSGGTPSVASMGCVRSDVTSLTVTDNGVGDITLTWPAGSFPSGAPGRAVVTLNDATGGNRAPSAELVTNGVRIRTTNGSGTATDLNFTVQVW